MALHQRVRVIARVIGEHKAEQRPVRIRPAPQQRRAQAVRQTGRSVQRYSVAGRGLFAHPQMRCHLVASQHPLDQNFQLAAAGLFTKKARLHDPCVVEHQQIPGAQQARQVVEDAVRQRRVPGVQQPRAAALGRRMLGDQLGRKREIKIAERESTGHGGVAKWEQGVEYAPARGMRRACTAVDPGQSGLHSLSLQWNLIQGGFHGCN